MENYLLQNSKEEYPEISLNAESAIMEFKGKSWPEDTHGVYEPVMNWIIAYKNHLANLNKDELPEIIHCKFEFIYLNSATSVVIREFLESVMDIQNLVGCDVKVVWKYIEMDLDILSLGNELEDYTELDFEMIPIT